MTPFVVVVSKLNDKALSPITRGLTNWNRTPTVHNYLSHDAERASAGINHDALGFVGQNNQTDLRWGNLQLQSRSAKSLDRIRGTIRDDDRAVRVATQANWIDQTCARTDQSIDRWN